MWIAELQESIYVARAVALKTHFVGLAAIRAQSIKACTRRPLSNPLETITKPERKRDSAESTEL